MNTPIAPKYTACGCPPNPTKYTNPETLLSSDPAGQAYARNGHLQDPLSTHLLASRSQTPTPNLSTATGFVTPSCYYHSRRSASEFCRAATTEAVAAQAASNAPEPYKAATPEAVPAGSRGGRKRCRAKAGRDAGAEHTGMALWGGGCCPAIYGPKQLCCWWYFTWFPYILSQSDNPPQSHAAFCRYSGVPPSPSSQPPTE